MIYYQDISNNAFSGHTSWSMGSTTFTTLFLLAKLRAFSKGEVWRLFISFLPVFGGVAVGVSRILDYRHHWTDVAAGSFIGVATAFLVYSIYYPRPWARHGAGQPLYLSRESKGLPLSVPSLSQGTCTFGEIRSLRPTGSDLGAPVTASDTSTQFES